MIKNNDPLENFEYKKKNNLIFLLIIFVLILVVQIYFGFLKKGYYVDEYYSFFSTNRTVGLYQPDREWQSAQTIRDEFVVKNGEGFNYGLVKQVQSWDVHPPLYYYLLHTVCSLFPNVFSKWLGIGTNLIGLFFAYIFLYLTCKNLELEEHKTMMILLIWGINPMTISAVMFIRMYMLLIAAFHAICWAHVRLLQAMRVGRIYDYSATGAFLRYVLPVMIISYLGFLTQYYYLIFFVFIGFFSVFYNMFIRKKVDVTAMGRSGLRTLSFRERLAESLIYVAGCAASLILAVLSYTACLSQIFHGYRGQEAVEAFTDGGNIITRISFFLGLLEDYVFGGMFKSLLLLFIVLIVIIQIVGKILDNTSGARVSLSVNISDSMKKVQLVMPSICILLLSVICYFLVVAKTALLLGATSNRYEMPVYGIIIMLVFMGLDFVLQECLMMLVKKKYKFIKMASFVCISILLLVVDIKGILLDENVLFLYPEAEERVTYAKENSDIPVIIMFNDSTPDNVWRLTDQILSYPEAYYVSEGNTEEITDETIISAEKLIVYAADHDNKEALLQMIVDSNESLEQVTERYSEEMWTMYVVE